VSLPFTPDRGQTSVLSLRLSAAERLALELVARQEGIRSRTGEPNQSGAVYLGLAYAFRYMPVGWRPANHLVVPGIGEPVTHLLADRVRPLLIERQGTAPEGPGVG
jgi:hypothetical protein